MDTYRLNVTSLYAILSLVAIVRSVNITVSGTKRYTIVWQEIEIDFNSKNVCFLQEEQ